jgi:hypothetical protein
MALALVDRDFGTLGNKYHFLYPPYPAILLIH